MEELRDLNQMAKAASDRISVYDGLDFELPQLFKDNVKEINSNSIKYNRYSAVIETKGYQNGTLNIYMPNQWFFVASFFTDLYNELMKYKRFALQVTTKERLKNLNGSELSNSENKAIQNLNISPESKDFLIAFITDYSWWGGAKTIDRGDFYVSPILSHAKLVNASQSFVADLCAFLADKQDLVNVILNKETEDHTSSLSSNITSNLQQIYYGAPGTGKSYGINIQTEGESVIRTTFHPDSDYSTFVGAYKPTTKEVMLRDMSGHIIMERNKETGKDEPVTEDRIVYEFVEQAFLQAYVKAWKFYAENPEEPQKQFLIIEEINRGNCAQIFGDLFQLLDRNEDGFSSYDIKPDTDIKKFIQKQNLNVSEIFDASGQEDISDKINNGELLSLPPNFYIWATMNTSDQSLFPIDSAFKRRWEWQYVPIAKGHDEEGNELQWRIEANTKNYDWWSFLEKINAQIAEATQSEDKKLGFFFCKAKDGIICAEKFVGKVIFYLWNDVFKNYDLSGPAFQDIDGTTLTFDKFYKADNKGQAVVQKDKIELFLSNLGVEDREDIEEIESEEDNETSEKYPLKVTFGDGVSFSSQDMKKNEVFIRVLKHIGLDKVEPLLNVDPLPFNRKGCPIVSKEAYEGILQSKQFRYVQEDGYYIVSSIKDTTKVPLLNYLKKKLNLDLTIESPLA